MVQTRFAGYRPALAGVLAFMSSGCSLLFVKGPPDASSSEIISGPGAECTSSKLAPGFDTAFAGLEIVRTGLAASADDSVYQNPNQLLSREADVGLGIGFAALFLGSAIYGFATTERCTKLQQPVAPTSSSSAKNVVSATPAVTAVLAVCEANARQCLGTTPQTCGAGQWVAAPVTADQCGAVCSPGSSPPRCSSGIPQSCDSAGHWRANAPCSDAQECQAGECAPKDPAPLTLPQLVPHSAVAPAAKPVNPP